MSLEVMVSGASYHDEGVVIGLNEVLCVLK